MASDTFKNAFPAVYKRVKLDQQNKANEKRSVNVPTKNPEFDVTNFVASKSNLQVASEEVQQANASEISADIERERMRGNVSVEDSRSLFIHHRQKKNKALLCHISNVPVKFASYFLPDFYLGNGACALFLSVKYHRLHPDYIKNRVGSLKKNYSLRVILTLVDVQDFCKSLQVLLRCNEVTLCVYNTLTTSHLSMCCF